jgi:predicted  nucleic acid-binding Zn-ribbon protein
VPHECVDCGDVFDDGSDEVFDGCPSCGGTKFFYVKQVGASEDRPEPPGDGVGAHADDVETSDDGSDVTADGVETSDDTATDEHSARNEEPQTAAETQTGSGDDRGIVEAEDGYERAFGGSLNDEDGEDPADDPLEAETDGETDDEIHDVPPSPDTDGEFRRAHADEARDELMDQFETIRIVEPGSYELNLMNLYEEDEKIIALQEDGRYQVSLPTALED